MTYTISTADIDLIVRATMFYTISMAITFGMAFGMAFVFGKSITEYVYNKYLRQRVYRVAFRINRKFMRIRRGQLK
ncbi:hypothetical protein [Chromobacterium sinusclupearum]|nr:hypothetical protein [Chromobacterium sinusclupearum]